MTEITNRKQAMMCGSSTYYTGRLCPNGHLAPRYVIGGACLECKRESGIARRKVEQAARDKKRRAKR